MHRFLKLLPFMGIFFLVSCGDDNNNTKEDVTGSVNKAGAVETSVTVQHADSTHDIVLTTHKIWVNFAEYKTFTHQDTIPALGTEHTTGENAAGDTASVNVRKDYEIFITVK